MAKDTRGWIGIAIASALAATGTGCMVSSEPVSGSDSQLWGVTCGPNSDALVAEDGTSLGTVAVSNDSDGLNFAISASGPIASVRIYAGIPPEAGGPVPFGCSGSGCDLIMDNLNETLASPASSASYSLAWSSLPMACGADVKIIVKVTLADGTVAWARAEDTGLHYENVYWDYYTACVDSCTPPPPPPSEGCTLTQGFWKTHPTAWPVGSLTLGTRSYSEAELLVFLNTPPRGNASLILIHQLIAAKLNVASGAAAPGTSIASADAWIAAHQALGMSLPFSGLAKGDAATAIGLSTLLDNYNNGLSGPPHCD